MKFTEWKTNQQKYRVCVALRGNTTLFTAMKKYAEETIAELHNAELECILRLRYVECLSVPQTAKVAGISVRTVKRKTKRALAILERNGVEI